MFEMIGPVAVLMAIRFFGSWLLPIAFWLKD